MCNFVSAVFTGNDLVTDFAMESHSETRRQHGLGNEIGVNVEWTRNQDLQVRVAPSAFIASDDRVSAAILAQWPTREKMVEYLAKKVHAHVDGEHILGWDDDAFGEAYPRHLRLTSMYWLRHLPAGLLHIRGDLDLEFCRRLQHVSGLQIDGSLDIESCDELTHLEDLKISGDLYARSCDQLDVVKNVRVGGNARFPASFCAAEHDITVDGEVSYDR